MVGVSDELVKLRALVGGHIQRINTLRTANKAEEQLGKLLSSMLGLDIPNGRYVLAQLLFHVNSDYVTSPPCARSILAFPQKIAVARCCIGVMCHEGSKILANFFS